MRRGLRWDPGRGPDGVGDQVGHGEHCRPGVERESVAVQDAGPAARLLFSLDDGHVVAAAGEVARRRQAG